MNLNLKNNWWKFLAVVIMFYVLTAGMLIPMKSGIYGVDSIALVASQNTVLEVEGYNANYDKAQEFRAWLKFDSSHVVLAKAVSIKNYNTAQLTFDLNVNLPGKDDVLPATLIIDNEIDGYAIFPEGLVVTRNASASAIPFRHTVLKDLHVAQGIKFPYMNILHETIRNTFFHVAIWMAMFLLMTIALIYSILYLWKPRLAYDHHAYSFTAISLVYGIIGLATGAVWARFSWGAYWTNDVRLNMAAVAVLIYFAYFILRGSLEDEDKRNRFAAAFNIFAYFAMIPLLLIIPRLNDSLHPGVGGNPAFSGEDLDNTLRMVFYPAIISLILFGVWIAQLRFRVFQLEEKHIDKINSGSALVE